MEEEHEKCKKILEAWCSECGINEPIAYEKNSSENKIIIYTNKCGIMIGKYGKTVDKYRKILAEEFYRNSYDVEFKDIHGRFVNYK